MSSVARQKKYEWGNLGLIIVDYLHIVRLNGKQTVDVVDEQEAKRVMSGILALQLHAGPPMIAQFKNIRLKKL